MKTNRMKGILYEDDFTDNDIKLNSVTDLVLEHIRQEPILDVGCGNGNLLYFLKNKFDCEGFDASPLGILRSRTKGLNVYLSSIDEFEPKRKYKTIIISGVLAHLYNLEEDFKKIISWLDYDGEIIVVMPNVSSLFFKRHKSHIWLPSYFNFRKFVKKNNLKIKKCIGAGRLRYFPFFSSVNFYILTKEKEK